MILIALFDKKAAHYLAPVSFVDVTAALRRYQQALLNEVRADSPPWMQYPEDFDMYQCGEFIEQTGQLVAYEHPQFFEHLVNLTKKGGSNA